MSIHSATQTSPPAQSRIIQPELESCTHLASHRTLYVLLPPRQREVRQLRPAHSLAELESCTHLASHRALYVLLPPRQREVRQLRPAHSLAEPAAVTPRRHRRVLRHVVRPAVGVEGRHIIRPRDIPQPDGGLDVGDGAPRRRLVNPPEQEEVPPARALQSDVLEGGCPRRALATGTLDFDALERAVDEEAAVVFAAGARRLARVKRARAPDFSLRQELGKSRTPARNPGRKKNTLAIAPAPRQ